MAIIGKTRIIPNNAQSVAARQIASVSGTWYTALNISNVAGTLQRTGSYAGGGNFNSNMEIEITIDGGAPYVIDTTFNSGATGIAGDQGTWRSQHLDYIQLLKFDNSLLVRYRQTTGGAIDLECVVDYGLF